MPQNQQSNPLGMLIFAGGAFALASLVSSGSETSSSQDDFMDKEPGTLGYREAKQRARKEAEWAYDGGALHDADASKKERNMAQAHKTLRDRQRELMGIGDGERR